MIRLFLFLFFFYANSALSQYKISNKEWDELYQYQLILQYNITQVEKYKQYLSSKTRRPLSYLRSMGKSIKRFDKSEVKSICKSLLNSVSISDGIYLIYLVAEIESFKDLKKEAGSLLYSYKLKTADSLFWYNEAESKVSIPVDHPIGRMGINKPSINFNYKGQSFTISVALSQTGFTDVNALVSVKEGSYNFDGANLYNIANCFNILSNFKRLPLVSISVTSPKNASRLNPLATILKLDSIFDKANASEIPSFWGDVSPKGEVNEWGYLRELELTSKTPKVFVISNKYISEIRDMTRIYGLKFLFKHKFFGVKNLNEAMKIQYGRNARYTHARLILGKLLKSLSGDGRKLGRAEVLAEVKKILDLYPDCLSAQVIKEAYLGKFPSKISYKTSYSEANYFSYVVMSRNADKTDLSAVENDIKLVQKFISPDFKKMLTYTQAALDNLQNLEDINKNGLKKVQGTTDKNIIYNQKLLHNIRLIKYEREKILDKQVNVEKLY